MGGRLRRCARCGSYLTSGNYPYRGAQICRWCAKACGPDKITIGDNFSAEIYPDMLSPAKLRKFYKLCGKLAQRIEKENKQEERLDATNQIKRRSNSRSRSAKTN